MHGDVSIVQLKPPGWVKGLPIVPHAQDIVVALFQNAHVDGVVAAGTEAVHDRVGGQLLHRQGNRLLAPLIAAMLIAELPDRLEQRDHLIMAADRPRRSVSETSKPA